MSSTSMPWSIKGVSADARGLAKTAAQRAGQAIGPWLNQLIRAANQVELEAASGPSLAAVDPAPLPAPSTVSGVQWRGEIDELTKRIAKLEERAEALVGPLDQAIERIARRLDAIETRRLESPDRLESPHRLESQGLGLPS
jgi:hypothetical protein